MYKIQIETMSKLTKKKTFYNQDILDIIKERYGFGYDYIRKSIAGERVGTIPLQMKEEYEKLEKEAKRAINIKKGKL
jgi:hypothetical protein